jgi:membrane-bound lytic murein transglycosylase D
MRSLRSGVWLPAIALSVLALLASTGTASAQQPSKARTSVAKPARKASSKASTPKDKAPRQPAARLPEGAVPPEPDTAARRRIAGGPTQDDLNAGVADPELRALRAAERALFPEPLFGQTSTSGRGEGAQAPRVSATGLPPVPVMTERPDPPLSASDARWLETLSLPNIPVRFDPRVVRYLLFYRDSAQGRAILRSWTRKSGRYTPALRVELAKAGLPTDLVWLSLIESGHNAAVSSPAGAAGLWQFMAGTARLYGLTVDRWVDERLDPARSTEAAIRYLSDLHRRFGNWELAMAAYNMGHGGLSRSLQQFNTNDFWELARYEAGIPWETALYVPKILAIAVVMANKSAFRVDDVVLDPPEAFDTLRVEPGVPLAEVARAANVSESRIIDLNRQFLAGRTPPVLRSEQRHWLVRVPHHRGFAAQAALVQHGTAPADHEPYLTKVGDTPALIAQSYLTSEAALRKINGLASNEVIEPATVLLVPRLVENASPVPVLPEVVVVSAKEVGFSDRKRVFYRVVAGDTLSRVASAFGVSRADLLSWNMLDESARLQEGLVLQVFVKPEQNLDQVRYVPDGSARLLVAGSEDFFDYFEGLKGRRRILVAAREGDTLASLGQRYGMSAGWMERVNRRSRRDQLAVGERAVVYVDRAPAGAAMPASETTYESLPAVEPPEPGALPVAVPTLDLQAAAEPAR